MDECEIERVTEEWKKTWKRIEGKRDASVLDGILFSGFQFNALRFSFLFLDNFGQWRKEELFGQHHFCNSFGVGFLLESVKSCWPYQTWYASTSWLRTIEFRELKSNRRKLHIEPISFHFILVGLVVVSPPCVCL